MRKRLIWATVAAVAAGVLAAPALATHAWESYHWARTANPFTVRVIDSNTSTWDGHLNTAVSDWNASSVLDVVREAGAEDKRCRPVAGKARSCNARYGKNGWLGIAQIWASGSHITQATAKMNDTYFDTAAYDDPTKRQHVMCQEVGHDWGLGHQDESGADLNTCMDYSDALDNPHPNQHDYEQLESIYAHVDGTSTVAGTPAAGLAADESARPEHVERLDRIATSTIVESFRDGTRRITHVTWALDAPQAHRDRAPERS